MGATRGASFNIQPVQSPADVAIHNGRAWTAKHREPRYLLPAEHRLGHWRVIGEEGGIEARHAEKLALASGRAKATPGYSPLTEGVLVLPWPSGDTAADRERFTQMVREYAAEIEAKLGHKVIDAVVHLDEGRVEGRVEDGVPIVNSHAHFVIDRTDDRGRTIRFTPAKLRELQDAAARVTGLERGKPAKETGLKHLDPGQYRAAARAGRLLTQERADELAELVKSKTPPKAIAVELVTRAEPGGPPAPPERQPEGEDEEAAVARYRQGEAWEVPAFVEGWLGGRKQVTATIDGGPLILKGIEVGRGLRNRRLDQRIEQLEAFDYRDRRAEYDRGHAAGVYDAKDEIKREAGRAGWVPAAERDRAEKRAIDAEARAAEAQDREARLRRSREGRADKAAQADQAELTRLRLIERDLARERAQIAQARTAAELAGKAEAARLVQEAQQSAETQARGILARAEQQAVQRVQKAEAGAADKEALAERYHELRGLMKASGRATQADYQTAKTRRHDPPWIEERIAALAPEVEAIRAQAERVPALEARAEAAEARATTAERQDGRWKAAVEATTRDLLPGNTAPPALWTISRVFQHAGEAVPAAIQRKYQQARDAGRDGRGG